MITNTEIMGYRIEQTNDPKAPYVLHGKRGACYGLMRSAKKPHMLYPVNLSLNSFSTVTIRGNGWLRDDRGVLEAVS